METLQQNTYTSEQFKQYLSAYFSLTGEEITEMFWKRKNYTLSLLFPQFVELGHLDLAMYDLGYRNNNCIGCVKGGMGYWNKIRIDFPEVFERMAKLEREIGHSCINGIFLDELELGRGRMEDEIIPDCSVMCYLNDL